MPKRFDLLAFDWDGTLVDSAAHIVLALQEACRDLSLPVPSEPAARHVIGLGLKDALFHILPELDESYYGAVVERYRIHYLAGDAAIKPFAMVPEGLARLKEAGFLLAVATGKSRGGLDRAMKSLNLEQRFNATRCADEGFPKPHPDMLLRIMDSLGVAPARVLMVGDTTHDLQMAANAGVGAVAACYGAHPKADLERFAPFGCFDSFPDLLQWLHDNA